MATDRKEANLKMLAEADEIQQKTKETVFRIQQQAAETEDIGKLTLEQLRQQGQQMDDISSEVETVNAKLDQSAALQRKFDVWAGNWLGGKKRQAMKEAAAEIAEANKADHSKVREVYQNEKYDALSRTWKSAGMVLCNNPTMEAHLFDPSSQAPDARWAIDYSLAAIDPEGWTYGYDFTALNKTGSGDAAPKWNSYVRRRKWKYTEKSIGAAGVDGVRERQEARQQKEQAKKLEAGASQAQKIGYVPRNQKVDLKASGLTSSRGAAAAGADDSQELDSESAAGLARVKAQDAEIDAGLDSISRTLDNLGNIASSINDETRTQNKKLEKLEGSLQKVQEKQTVVNARQRYLLK